MLALILLALVGLVAQLVDGTLGMGYGVTSSSLLLAVGLSPALASASVHLSQIGTTLMSGVSHLRLGNTDRALVARLAVPGAVGAFLGATVLSRLATAAATPVTTTILLVLGIYVLVRFAVRPPTGATARNSPHTSRLLTPLGLIGGFIDATGGGGWGPVVTTTLLSRGRTAPRTIVGSVDTAEFIVSVTASLGFLLGLGTAGIDFGVVVALLGGGMLAAPLAAWAVSRMPGTILGTAVGGLIVVTNTVTVLETLGLSTTVTAWTLSALVAALLPLIALTVHRTRRTNVVAEVQAA
ncbi:sulfite exporter TauE/SafE family protein [Actinomyces glycerinitolerans]|uniref:Probable membrane transporter protein n=1 Tax=Actinomyces glycerinitolerans TaxID=1892869 RepID=A0A1M4S296_9ACTO|nr:sulfite exporter TauE/SafE family protein [Actinomyces glycerinitolerans]SHE26364.1 sulfite exporter taue/safe [Actinomyces glycerinitolerans]